MGGGGLVGGGGFVGGGGLVGGSLAWDWGLGGGGLETGLGGVGRFSLATTSSYLGGAEEVMEEDMLGARWPALYFPGWTTLTEGVVVRDVLTRVDVGGV